MVTILELQSITKGGDTSQSLNKLCRHFRVRTPFRRLPRVLRAILRLSSRIISGFGYGMDREFITDIKMMMMDAVVNTYFDPSLQLCVFSDASEEFYCMVFTQCVHGAERLPWAEQVGKHRLLLVLSGRFRHAQLR